MVMVHPWVQPVGTGVVAMPARLDGGVCLTQPLVRPVCKACGESLLVLQDAGLKRLGLHPKHPQLPLIIALPSRP